MLATKVSGRGTIHCRMFLRFCTNASTHVRTACGRVPASLCPPACASSLAVHAEGDGTGMAGAGVAGQLYRESKHAEGPLHSCLLAVFCFECIRESFPSCFLQSRASLFSPDQIVSSFLHSRCYTLFSRVSPLVLSSELAPPARRPIVSACRAQDALEAELEIARSKKKAGKVEERQRQRQRQ